MKYKMGIICASDQEIAPFIPMIEECSISKKAMLTFYQGTMETIEVVALFCGVCKTNAAIAAQILLDSYGCQAIINAGTAGGMHPSVQLFDTIIATESAYWDVAGDILTEFHPWMPTIYFKTDEKLLALLKSVLAINPPSNIHFGRMITGESFIEDKHRMEINEMFAPLSVDMETASIAHVCYVNRIPYIAVRTITDTSQYSGVDQFALNCEKASQISANMVKVLLKALSQTTNH